MLRFIARRYAKAAYVFRQEVEASTNELNAGLALRTAAEKHKLAAQLTEQADQMDARIKEMDAKLETGFWECENGHEWESMPNVRPDAKRPANLCVVNVDGKECGGEVKLIKRDQMTGQEKYESDRERKDAEDLSKAKRDQAAAEEDNAAQSEKAAKYLQALATNIRNTTEKIRKL
jgi:hypothetical protein